MRTQLEDGNSVQNARSIVSEYWNLYPDWEPLDAFTLGVTEAGAHLPDLRPAAWAARDSEDVRVLKAISEIKLDELPPDLGKSIEAVRRLALYSHHQFERGFYLRNIAYSDIPPLFLMFQAGQAKDAAAWDAIASRCRAYPAFLTQYEANLTEGRRRNLHPDYEETRSVAARLRNESLDMLQNQIPALARQANLPKPLASQVQEAMSKAADALEAHAKFLDTFVSGLPRDWVPDGEQEVAWRLRELHGLDQSPRMLFEQASEWIRLEREKFVERARAVDPGIVDLAQADSLLKALRQEDQPKTGEEALDLYHRAQVRLNRDARSAGIPVPEGFEVQIVPAPPGFYHIAPVSNIPGSLLNRDALPLFVVSIEKEALPEHTAVEAAVMTAHEGLPGHALTSAWWTFLYGGSPAPIAWAHQHDLTNSMSGSWQTMQYIEGWGLLAEGLLADTYTPEEALAQQAATLLRAVRVKIDVGLHSGFLDRAHAAQVLSEETGMDLEKAKAQIIARYGRKTYLGQALCYYTGMRAIEELRKGWLTEHPTSTANDFYAELFRQPPLPPSVLRWWMLTR